MDYKWIAKNYTESFRDNKRFSIAEVINSVNKDWVLQISTSQVYKVKEFAIQMMERSYAEQYALLWDYCEELNKKNPGITTKIKVEMGADAATIFHCIYICLAACKKGFLEACRHLIGLDGVTLRAHLVANC